MAQIIQRSAVRIEVSNGRRGLRDVSRAVFGERGWGRIGVDTG